MAWDLEKCLQRIDYRGPREPDPGTLADLQEQFLLHVPFENLDIHLDRPITLNLEDIYDKIVVRGRGGFCYECNSLFHAMLTGLGFRVSFLGATMLVENTLPLEFGHMVLVVELERPWLVDVGNGQSCRKPLCLAGGNSARSEGIEYRVRGHEGGRALYWRDGSGQWRPRYRFSETPQDPGAFEEPCRIQQTSPDSRFTRHCLASLALPDGRVTLLDRELTVQRSGESWTVPVADAAAYGETLAEQFGIQLPAEDIQMLYNRIDS